jgi:TPR repeat protein
MGRDMTRQPTTAIFGSTVKPLLLIAMLMIAALASAQPAPPVYDPNSTAALEAKAKYDAYNRDGQGLRTAELSAELERLNAAKKSRMALLTKPEEILAAAFKMTDDDMRAVSYATVLKKRSDNGDPDSSFFYGVHQWDFCSQLQRQQGEMWAKQASECWQGLLPAFKRASDAQIANASFNIGKLYENGFGVSPSKLVAAEWYVKAAVQYNKGKLRDEALTAVERAVDLVPDHPAARRLRKAMLK